MTVLSRLAALVSALLVALPLAGARSGAGASAASRASAGTSVPEAGADAYTEPALRVESTSPATMRTGRASGATVVGELAMEPFTLIGARLEAQPQEELGVRVHSASGWSEWMHLEIDPEHGPDPGREGSTPGVVSDPIWVREADGYQLRLPPDLEASEVEVLVVRETTEQVPVERAQVLARVTSPHQPPIRSRAAWGARPYEGTPEIADHLKLAVVHHSVSTNSYSPSEVPGIIRGIQAFHMDANGWSDIAYNFVVDRFGTIWEGRQGGVGRAIIGGHSKGFNTGSTGVVAIGDFSASSAPSAMRSSIGSLLGWKLFHHGLDPSDRVDMISGGGELWPEGEVVNLPRIVGHREVNPTGCPGNGLYTHIGEIRSRADSVYEGLVGSGSFSYQSVSVNGTYTPLVGDFNGDGTDDIFWYGPGTAYDSLWLAAGDGRFRWVSVKVNGTYTPLVGDFNGDWSADIFWYGPGGDYDSIWLSTGAGRFNSVSITVNGTYTPVLGQFSGDDRTDIIWYGAGADPDSYWLGAGEGTFNPRGASIDGTYLPLVGDFDFNWREDVLWYGPGSDHDALWMGSTSGTFSERDTSVSGVYSPFVGDFDGNGPDDIFWYGPGGGYDAVWLARGDGSFRSLARTQDLVTMPLVGDFTGGGLTDVLWYAAGLDPDSFWEAVGGGSFTPRARSVTGSYTPLVGEFTGDGRGDIFWYGPGPAYDTFWAGKG